MIDTAGESFLQKKKKYD